MRALIQYGLSLVILILYGVQVCPFLESLTPMQLGLPIATALVLQLAIRKLLAQRLMSKTSLAKRVRRLLTIDLSLFVASGLALTIFNTLTYDFPIGSGLKVIVGFVSLGFFVAVDLSLQEEFRLAQHVQQTGTVVPHPGGMFPVSYKLGIFAAVSAIMVTAVLFLVVNKDLGWLLDVSKKVSLADARFSITKEFLFVALVILAHVFNIIHSYARNLRFFFDTENQVLQRTNEGDLNGYVPVSTNDEFGLMAHYTNLMVKAIRQRTEEIQRTQDVTILGLASLAETRDNETGAHILRTQRYVCALARRLADHPRFHKTLTKGNIELLFKSAPLHDIGKVGIPDAILLKPGKLTETEFDIMKTHATLGSESLQRAEKELGADGGNSFLRYAREIAETHHEKWDGSGYPKGLKGENIPISGRLMSLADVYDALISRRVYKPPYSHEKSKDIILAGRGTHFDPDIVDAFIAAEEEFCKIANSYRDEDHVPV